MRNSILIVLTLITLNSCREEEKVNWTDLLDKDLTQWDSYLSYRFKTGETIPKDKEGNSIPPIGTNQDQYQVFTVIEEEDEPVLKISGEIYGCVFTKKEYANYHLKLKVKWGDKKSDPRKNLLKDSGILYHSIGPLGVDGWSSWMLSQEFQIMEGHMGDYWSVGNSAVDVKAFMPEYIMNPIANVNQPFIKIGTGEEIPGFCLRSDNFGNDSGNWDTMELICFEDKSIHIVNGKVVMVLKNSRHVENGKSIPMTQGKIQIQSEAAEVYYKNIEIRTLEALPTEYSQYFQ